MTIQRSLHGLPCTIPQQGHFHTIHVVFFKISSKNIIYTSIYLLYLHRALEETSFTLLFNLNDRFKTL